MNIYISYFNNLRNFNKYCIPISTAKWDPKWFHNKDGSSFIDKNGVINGLRCEKLVFPDSLWNDLSLDDKCKKECSLLEEVINDGVWCKFMIKYLNYLKTINFKNLFNFFEIILYKMGELQKEDPSKFSIILLVHEKTERNCAERPVLQKWFKQNDYELKEWRKENSNEN